MTSTPDHANAEPETARPARLAHLGQVRWIIPATCAVVLIPWTLYLHSSLPGTYTTTLWSQVWTGFDALFCTCLALTALLCALRRPAAVLAQTACATLLATDAWFDFMTSTAGDHASSVAGLFIELPLSATFLAGAVLTLRRLLATTSH